MTVNAFSKLHPRIIEGLQILGIDEPTVTQEMAIEPINSGENVLLVAPTASGKTEAAILPVFDLLFRRRLSKGIELVYITPLRALNRDIHKRLMFWADHLNIDVQIRHGDTLQRERRKQSVKPPRVLITTPETLQAILPTKAMRHHLKSVKWVIVDEIHELAASKRGVQLVLGLERLERLTERPYQRIGLSATVGNPEEMACFLGGKHQVKVVSVKVDKKFSYSVVFPKSNDKSFDLADDLSISPESASRLLLIRESVNRNRSTLIFVQGRGQSESLGHRLGKVEPLIDVHHGSLSREQRHQVEDRFKAGELKGIICTSTLQLGIDVGDVDLSIQYMSPRQVSTLIQRVGRAGHTLKQRSDGLMIPAFGEDALESIVIAERARRYSLEKTTIHLKSLDVLAHQIVGLMLDFKKIEKDKVFEIVECSYPFKNLEREEFNELVRFLVSIGIISELEGFLKMRKKGRKYYYENLGMMNDERRYPFINAITDKVIGTVGDEFWTLRARLGLNVILKGRVWRIIHIDEDEGVLHVIPSEDPLGALPGWDGELIPVTKEIAEDVGEMREKIIEELENLGSEEKVIEKFSDKYNANKNAIKTALDEIMAHKKLGFSIPSKSRILLEGYKKFLIIHSSFGERTNRTLGAIFDAILSENDLIYGWWNDPYRILVEAPRNIDRFDIEKIRNIFLNLSNDELGKYLGEFIESRFPFVYNMKFIAERFGVIPKGKTLSSKSLENLYIRFKGTPIYQETLREAHQEKLDLESVKKIFDDINSGRIEILTVLTKTPSPLARHILEKYAEVEELMEPKYSSDEQLDNMKASIQSRKVNLFCMGCSEWSISKRIREIEEKPTCLKCGSNLLSVLRKHQNSDMIQEIQKRRLKNELLSEDEKNIISYNRKTADLVLSYGKKAIVALMVRGVGPITAYQILSRMHQNENDLYEDLLKAKIQYLRTKPYWNEK